MVGQTLAGRYRIDTFVADGSNSLVYRGWDLEKGHPVAVKRIKTFALPNGDSPAVKSMEESVVRDIKHLRSLNHSSIPRYLDFVFTCRSYFLVMEWVEGVTLESKLSRCGSLSLPEVLGYMRELADLFSYIREGSKLTVLHPGDIMITPEGKIRIIDFGVARSSRRNGRTFPHVRCSGYLPPESDKPGYVLSEDSRIYTLGALVYHMVTGKNPGEFRVSPPDPREFNPELPQDFALMIMRCLQVREKRLASFSFLLEQLKLARGESEKTEKKPEWQGKTAVAVEMFAGTAFMFFIVFLPGIFGYLVTIRIIPFLGAALTLTLPGNPLPSNASNIGLIAYIILMLTVYVIGANIFERMGVNRYYILSTAMLPVWIAMVLLFCASEAYALSSSAVEGFRYRAYCAEINSTGIALKRFARENGGKYPSSVSQLVPTYLDSLPSGFRKRGHARKLVYRVSGDRKEFMLSYESDYGSMLMNNQVKHPQYCSSFGFREESVSPPGKGISPGLPAAGMTVK